MKTNAKNKEGGERKTEVDLKEKTEVDLSCCVLMKTEWKELGYLPRCV